MAGLLNVSTTDFVTTMRMNRPPVNALIAEFQEELIEALNRVKDDDATRVVLLTSAIDRYFMAGADIKSMGGEGGFDRDNPATLERVAQMSRRSQAAFNEVEHFPKPLIAAINGHALGGGCELALACDYRLMIDDGRSTIGQTETNLGLIPGAGGTQRLPRLLGRGRATEMIFESIRLKAPEAAAIGLVTAAGAGRADRPASGQRGAAGGPGSVARQRLRGGSRELRQSGHDGRCDGRHHVVR
jgi:enoyl-CoA hydratase